MLKKDWARNIGVVFLLVLLTSLYFVLFASRVPPEAALIVNFGVFPVVTGLVGFLSLVGPFYLRLLLILAIPIAHVLYFGGDPAKPGLEMGLFYVEVGGILVGLGIGYVAARVFQRRPTTSK